MDSDAKPVARADDDPEQVEDAERAIRAHNDRMRELKRLRLLGAMVEPVG